MKQVLSKGTGTVWAAPDKPGPGQASPGQEDPVHGGPGQAGPGQGEPGPEKPGPGGPGQSQFKPKPPPLMGSVIQAYRDKVTINIGAAEGVHPGMIFFVKRVGGPKFRIIAEIKAERIRPHSTDCRVVKWLTPERRIRPNDKVEKR